MIIADSNALAKVKCLVCGEIFAEGSLVCPVCGAGADQFAPVAPDGASYRNDTREQFLIVGAGIAGVSAAKAIRERNRTCSITIINGEESLPYNRPMLTKNLFGQSIADQFVIFDEQWYIDNNITLVSDQRAAAIDTAGRIITLESGARLMYDKCVLALGARNFVPPIPGANLANIFGIRTQADARRVRNACEGATRAVIIGGGVLGIETASEMVKRNMDVTIVEAAPRLLAGKIAPRASDMLAEILRGAGANLYLGAQAREIAGDSRASAVRLESGAELPADIVIISTGIRANISVAKSAGLAADRGIAVDAHMKTSAPRVYACGDCASFDGFSYGLWAEAAAMGDAAGANAAGDAVI
jgi:NAD(P)H-nitrite reductase large subunit